MIQVNNMTTQEKKHIFFGIAFIVILLVLFFLSYRFQPPPTPVAGAPATSSRIDAIRGSLDKK
jgi:hypothetical protein